MELTEKDQDKILKSALKTIGLKDDRMFFMAVITGQEHPDDATKVEYKGEVYYVTIKHGDFVCIFLN